MIQTLSIRPIQTSMTVAFRLANDPVGLLAAGCGTFNSEVVRTLSRTVGSSAMPLPQIAELPTRVLFAATIRLMISLEGYKRVQRRQAPLVSGQEASAEWVFGINHWRIYWRLALPYRRGMTVTTFTPAVPAARPGTSTTTLPGCRSAVAAARRCDRRRGPGPPPCRRRRRGSAPAAGRGGRWGSWWT